MHTSGGVIPSHRGVPSHAQSMLCWRPWSAQGRVFGSPGPTLATSPEWKERTGPSIPRSWAKCGGCCSPVEQRQHRGYSRLNKQEDGAEGMHGHSTSASQPVGAAAGPAGMWAEPWGSPGQGAAGWGSCPPASTRPTVTPLGPRGPGGGLPGPSPARPALRPEDGPSGGICPLLQARPFGGAAGLQLAWGRWGWGASCPHSLSSLHVSFWARRKAQNNPDSAELCTPGTGNITPFFWETGLSQSLKGL